MNITMSQAVVDSLCVGATTKVITLYYTYESLNSCSCSDAGLFILSCSNAPLAPYDRPLKRSYPPVFTNVFSLTFMEEEMVLTRDSASGRLILSGQSGILSPNVKVLTHN
ncbi:iron-sulfur cluster biosynthesis family protein [Brochothrix campestris]|uniref:Core domain-containing protein n=1 Tax=Brochothrix campestris FSL F6-1037 TaxID=1265861 RepID=W7CCS0_9LIST|nr:iron-sulfur cluster biosynthesis family protein [Brochothrix campestris]EUJ37124.1 hypothetical protein BCAMP_10220 [Brochothrix campestris FSL F6-1037]